ncbi:hypothetical protein pEaSNUABM10_00110 [Erwinia phage pEa_SNUABM_10]|nr:hypothetical protein pEaSNUABM10_00110 [Erwinia phage pEa_SNUABM_10]
MSSPDLDFITLCEDFDTVVALESIGVGMNNPMMRSIAMRWNVLDEAEAEWEEAVARESNAMMERAQAVADGAAQGSIAKKVAKDAGKAAVGVGMGAARLAGKGAAKGAKAAGKGAAHLSTKLLDKFKEWAEHYGPIFKEKMADMTSKSTMMEKRRQKLESKLHTAEIHPQDVRVLTWASCVCFEDKPNLDKCIELSNHSEAMAAAVKEYTVKVDQTKLIVDRRKKNDDGTLDKIGYPSNAAIHRASGLLGRFTENDVKARPLAGNVIIVTRGFGAKEKVEFAVAREAQIGGKFETLSKAECEKALDAVKRIAQALEDRSVKRGVFSYTGIYENMEKLREHMKDLDGNELRAVTLQFKNAMAVEDAFTTALVRVGDGLLNWVQASIKAG